MILKFLSLAFVLEAETKVILPAYKGSAFRGGFGSIFKKIVCVLKREECPGCLLKDQCAYFYIFETSPPQFTKLMNMEKYEAIPRPFVIEPPVEIGGFYEQGQTIKFNLIIIGRAIDYLPYFIIVFDELGRIGLGKGRGKYSLKEVWRQDQLIYSVKTKKLKIVDPEMLETSEKFNFNGEPFPEIFLDIEFITPTRIKYQRNLVVNLEFHILIRNILRRLCLLSYFHEEMIEPRWNHKLIIEKAKEVKIEEKSLRWLDWERYSGRQKTWMKLGGLVGNVVYKGKIEPFLPLLKAGEILHVGKGTAFGLGKYKILER